MKRIFALASFSVFGLLATGPAHAGPDEIMRIISNQGSYRLDGLLDHQRGKCSVEVKSSAADQTFSVTIFDENKQVLQFLSLDSKSVIPLVTADSRLLRVLESARSQIVIVRVSSMTRVNLQNFVTHEQTACSGARISPLRRNQ